MLDRRRNPRLLVTLVSGLGTALALSVGASACGPDEPDPPPGPTCEQIELDVCLDELGDTYRFLVSQVDVPGPVSGIQVGLDVDCRTSDRRDPEGCGIADSTSPDGKPGVDNSVGWLIAQVEDLDAMNTIGIREASAAGFVDGSFVMDVELRGVESLAEDPCVMLVVNGATADGAFIEAGVLEAYFTALPLSLPTSAAPLAATLERVGLRGRVSASGIEDGVIGGELSIEEAGRAAVAVNPDAMYIDYVPTLIAAVADLAPDARGACQRISMGIELTAVTAP